MFQTPLERVGSILAEGKFRQRALDGRMWGQRHKCDLWLAVGGRDSDQ
jgi:hypothetical protein